MRRTGSSGQHMPFQQSHLSWMRQGWSHSEAVSPEVQAPGQETGGTRLKLPAPVRHVCACHGDPEPPSELLSLDPLNLFLLEKPSAADPVMVEFLINRKPVWMKVETGAAVTVMNRTIYERVEGVHQLKKSDLTLKTYTGELVRPCGVGEVEVVYQDQKRGSMPITVVEGNVPNLLGRDWLGQLKLQWGEALPIAACSPQAEGVLSWPNARFGGTIPGGLHG